MKRNSINSSLAGWSQKERFIRSSVQRECSCDIWGTVTGLASTSHVYGAESITGRHFSDDVEIILHVLTSTFVDRRAPLSQVVCSDLCCFVDLETINVQH